MKQIKKFDYIEYIQRIATGKWDGMTRKIKICENELHRHLENIWRNLADKDAK